MKKLKQVENRSASIPCNLCGSDDIRVLSLRDRERRYLRTVICRACGLVWSDPRPGAGDIRNFYSEKYRKEYKGAYIPAAKHLYRDAKEALRRYHFIKEVIHEKDSILDIGSGTGVFLYALRSFGFDICGVEPDRYYGEYAIKELGLPVKISFFQDIKFPDKFDIITMHHVLEHMENPFEILKRIRDLLNPDGFLYAGVPNAEDLSQAPGNRYHKAHIYTFNPETLTTMGQKAGFTTFKIHTSPHNGDIAVILQKERDMKNITGEIPGNYEKIVKSLNKNSFFHYFTTTFPYRKFIGNITRPFKEKKAIGKYKNTKEMLDSIIKKESS